jgi:large subunit ribosomal protein L22
MLIIAEQKNQRQTARKTRLVAEVVKKMSPEAALKQLAAMDRRASLAVLKVLRQAIANATNNHGLRFEDLVIADIIVNEGPTYKRWRAVSRGRAHTILKRTCHIRVELKTKEVVAEPAAEVAEPAKEATPKAAAVREKKSAPKATAKKSVAKKAVSAKKTVKK